MVLGSPGIKPVLLPCTCCVPVLEKIPQTFFLLQVPSLNSGKARDQKHICDDDVFSSGGP